MSPLYVWISALGVLDGTASRSPLQRGVVRALSFVAAVATLSICWSVGLTANAAPIAHRQGQGGINFRERPHYPSDRQRLRRTVQIDGVLGDGEWDAFYSITDGSVKGTIYCNWDENYLYLAARTEQPSNVLFDLDLTGDGWLRGSDNIELVVGGIEQGKTPVIVARQLDASNSKDTPVWNEKAIDPKTFLVAASVNNGTQFVEIAIPKNTASLVLRPGATLGIRAELLPPGPPSNYVPTQPFDPHLLLDATLVDARAQSAQGINPRLTLSDYKCVAGQTLFGTLELLNQTDHSTPIQSVSWLGQGTSSNVIDSIKDVSVPPLPSLKTLKLHYKSEINAQTPNGTYALNVVATLADGRQVTSAATFTVVEPLQVELSSDPQPVAVVGSTKLSVNVDVLSAVPDHMRGTVELTRYPAGWQLDGKPRREVYVDRKDGRKVVRFLFKLPSNTPQGDYAVEAVVTWKARSYKHEHLVRVIAVDIPPASKPVAPQ